jgi:Inorganic pyrophosphatase
LLAGLTYPYDWGFVPSTKAEDGDPLDIMVIHDAATFPGIVLTCRVIGILQIEQKSKGKAERNARLFEVPRRSHSEEGLRDVRDLPPLSGNVHPKSRNTQSGRKTRLRRDFGRGVGSLQAGLSTFSKSMPRLSSLNIALVLLRRRCQGGLPTVLNSAWGK